MVCSTRKNTAPVISETKLQVDCSKVKKMAKIQNSVMINKNYIQRHESN